jgi:hypothetical protein
VLIGKAAHYGLLLAVPALLHGLPAALAGAAGYSVSLSIVLAVVFFVSHNMPENKPNLSGADETKKVRPAQGCLQHVFAWVLAAETWLQECVLHTWHPAVCLSAWGVLAQQCSRLVLNCHQLVRMQPHAKGDMSKGRHELCPSGHCMYADWHVLCGCCCQVLYTPLVERDWGVQQVLASANWGGVVGNFFTGGLNLQVCRLDGQFCRRLALRADWQLDVDVVLASSLSG